jgi:two-component system response regulator RegA
VHAALLLPAVRQLTRIVPTILVVEDDDVFRGILVAAFRERGYEAEGVGDGASALRMAERESPEMAVVDLRLPDQTGLDVVRRLKAIDASTAIVVLTGYGSIATALESVRLGAVHYLTKPTDADRILAAFQHGLASRPRDLPTDPPSLGDDNVSEAARQLGMHAGRCRPLTLTPETCSITQLRYGLLDRIGRSYCYRLTTKGVKVA